MDKATWVGGPRDGQPVTAEELKQMTEPLFAAAEHWGRIAERIRELEGALHALVDDEWATTFWDEDGDVRCIYCKSAPPTPHKPDCPVAKARALLQGTDAP